MKILIISYSLTGNNHALAMSIASKLNAEHIAVLESKIRTPFRILLDIVFHRTPKVKPKIENGSAYDYVIFMAPVWMGLVATPLRAYFENLKNQLGNYGFITISGGADGHNTKLEAELTKRLGKTPDVLIDMRIADLLPAEPKPKRKDTSSYRLKEKDVKHLTQTIVLALEEKLQVPVMN